MRIKSFLAARRGSVIAMAAAVLAFMASLIFIGPLHVAASVAPPPILASTADSSLPLASEVFANRPATAEEEAPSF